NSVSSYSPVHLALSQGAVFLGSNCTLDVSSRTYFAITRFSLDGSLVWSRKYSTPSQGSSDYGDSLEGFASDDSGNLYIVGSGGSSSSLSQTVFRKISGLGDVQFSKPF